MAKQQAAPVVPGTISVNGVSIPVLPRYLYHGTRVSAIESIKREGIRGRGWSAGNWQRTVTSNKQTVYLSNAYPLYFALHAADMSESAVVLEIDTTKLDRSKLQADEDALEQGLRGEDDLPKHWDVKRRTIYYRSRTHLYLAEASLYSLGTCGYRGVIHAGAVTRSCIVSAERLRRIIWEGYDPVISVVAYQAMGRYYQAWVKWLIGDDPLPDGVSPSDLDNLGRYWDKFKPGFLDREGIEVVAGCSAGSMQEVAQ